MLNIKLRSMNGEIHFGNIKRSDIDYTWMDFVYSNGDKAGSIRVPLGKLLTADEKAQIAKLDTTEIDYEEYQEFLKWKESQQ